MAGFKAGMDQAAASVRGVRNESVKAATDSRKHLDTLGRAGVVAGGAVALGLGAAVKAAMDFEQELAGLRAASGASVAEMERLSESALEAGKATAFSATEAAAAQTELAKAGVATADILGGGLQGALDLAAAGELGVANAAEIAATALTQFKLEGADVGHIADLLAAGANKAQGGVGDLGAALNQAGLVASQMGLSVDDTVGSLAAFASAGLIGSDAGTSFRSMLLRLANPTDEVKRLLADLNITAYDAQGQFVGMESLAGQLQDRLGGLTQAQRDQALAMIFGQDAIRTANILYSEGEQGISGWIDAVDQQGAATDTARIKMDNLAGDLERVSGAWSTLMIEFGENAQGPLRGVAQAVDGVLSGLAEMPEGAQTAALALGGVTSAAGLMGGGFLLAAPRIIETQTALKQLATSMPATTAAVRGAASMLMGPWGIALGAAAIGLGAYAQSKGEAIAKTKEFVATLDAETGALTQESRVTLSRALQDSGAYGQASELAISIRDINTAILEGGPVYDALQAKLSDVARHGIGTTDDAALRLGSTLEKQRAIVQNSAVVWEQEQTALGNTSAALSGWERNASGAARITDTLSGSTEQLASEYEALGGEVEDTRTEGEKLRDLFDELSGATIGADRANIAYEASLDAMRKSFKDNGDSLDANTQKGRENRSALLDMVEAAKEHVVKLADQDVGMKRLKGTFRDHIDDFRETASEAGLTDKQIDRLIDRYGMVPDTVETLVEADTADAEADLIRIRNLQVTIGSGTHLRLGNEAGGGGRTGGGTGGGGGGSTPTRTPQFSAQFSMFGASARTRRTSDDLFARIRQLEREEERRLRGLERAQARADRRALVRGRDRAARRMDTADEPSERRQAERDWRQLRREIKAFDQAQREMRRQERHDNKIARIERKAERLERREERAERKRERAQDRAEERADRRRDLRREMAENRWQVGFDRMNPKQQLAELDRLLGKERRFTDEWMSLYQQRLSLADLIAGRVDEPALSPIATDSAFTGIEGFAARLISQTGIGGATVVPVTPTMSTFILVMDGQQVGKVTAPVVSETTRIDLVAQS